MGEMTEWLLIPVAFGSAIAGWLWGKRHERIQWNKLIQAGKLPRPGWTQQLVKVGPSVVADHPYNHMKMAQQEGAWPEVIE